ncbi:hypothetical protein TNCV_4494251 [Trichonephila clavipes]|nr:hypothetical protein TNCV_4494251 [Trichonephila clavipes]
MREKGRNRLVPGPDYMVDALKLPNQASRVSGESLQTCGAWRCPDGAQHLFYWPILAVSGQSLASNGPFLDSRYLNLVFGLMKDINNKLFLSSPTKYTVEPSWMLVLVWEPFELLHRALTTIVFEQYCRMWPNSHPQSLSAYEMGRFHSVWPGLHRWKSIMFFGVNWCGTQTSSYFLNPTLHKWLKTVLWSIFSSWAMLRLLPCQ